MQVVSNLRGGMRDRTRSGRICREICKDDLFDLGISQTGQNRFDEFLPDAPIAKKFAIVTGVCTKEDYLAATFPGQSSDTHQRCAFVAQKNQWCEGYTVRSLHRDRPLVCVENLGTVHPQRQFIPCPSQFRIPGNLLSNNDAQISPSPAEPNLENTW